MRSRVALAAQVRIAASTAAVSTMTTVVFAAPQVRTVSAGVAINSRHGEPINQGHGEIHHQHRERDTIGITAPRSYDVRDQPDARSIDKLSLLTGRGGNGVR